MTFSVTERQDQLLLFIYKYMADHGGIAPTFGEMCVGIKTPSKSKVSRLLAQLEKRGHIRRLRYTSRAIEIVGAPTTALLSPELRLRALRYCAAAECEMESLLNNAVREYLTRVDSEMKGHPR